MGNHLTQAPQIDLGLELARYYTVAEVARLMGLHETTVYQAVGGIKRIPVPRATRLGRTVRFLGHHILDFIEQQSGVTMAAAADPVVAPTATAKRGRGRPRNVARASEGAA